MSINIRKQAFSLIEISIVVLIIGILIAGVTQSSRLITQFKLTTARNLTNTSPVNGIADLVSWYESTSKTSFSEDIQSGDSIAYWYDIASSTTSKNDGSQSTSGYQPTYSIDTPNGLPVVNFDGDDDFLDLPDGTVPYNNSPYTVFIVSRANVSGSNLGLLSTGVPNTTNKLNSFRYNKANKAINYWWAVDIESVSTRPINEFEILAFDYDTENRNIYINGSTDASDSISSPDVGSAVTGNESTDVNNYIGLAHSGTNMSGDIAEIIIFDRAIKNGERESINDYLSKKWDITLP